jgi:hypothetical protein
MVPGCQPLLVTHQVTFIHTSQRAIGLEPFILAEGAIALSVTLSGGALFAS